MRKYITLLFLVTITVFASAQGVEKTLLKSFSLDGNTKVLLDFDGEVEVKEWSTDNMMRVQMEITLHNTNKNMFKYLLTKGRYNLESQQGSSTDGFTVSNPSRNTEVVINKQGDKLKETVRYVVFIPSNVTARVVNSNTETSMVEKGGATSLK